MPRKLKTHAQRLAERNGRPRDMRVSARKRGYTNDWDKARAWFLRSHPLCIECQRHGITRAANIVDHIVPHGGDAMLFWSIDNWQALCRNCHAHKTGRERRAANKGRM